jgi:hypothetical protein
MNVSRRNMEAADFLAVSKAVYAVEQKVYDHNGWDSETPPKLVIFKMGDEPGTVAGISLCPLGHVMTEAHGEAGKDLVASLFNRLVSLPESDIVALITEAWVSEVEPQRVPQGMAPEQFARANEGKLPRPSQDPKRQERLAVSMRSKDYTSLVLFEIDRAGRRLVPNEPKFDPQERFSGRFAGERGVQQ